jgi:hypothetical protein
MGRRKQEVDGKKDEKQKTNMDDRAGQKQN